MDTEFLTQQDVEKFWAKVDVAGEDECWVWHGNTLASGYGLFDRRRDGKRIARRAHRVAYELLVGPIPEGLMLRHTCDNPPCVNPAHLVPGTAKDNSQDMVQRRRHWVWIRPERLPRGEDHWTAKRGSDALPHGEAHHRAKITWQQVCEIRERYANGGISQRALARLYGLTQGAVWQIIHGNHWRNP